MKVQPCRPPGLLGTRVYIDLVNADEADQAAMVDELFAQLRRRERWLLIYDNAEQPHTLDGLLPPGGAGNVLVTSRWAAWGRHAESLRFLTGRTGITDTGGLGVLAELLGDPAPGPGRSRRVPGGDRQRARRLPRPGARACGRAVRRRAGGRRGPAAGGDIGIRRNNLGGALRSLGDLTGARAEFERALRICETALGPDHPQTRTARANLDRLDG